MKLPAYPHYKPSGSEWLGDVPEHWEVTRLRYVCRFAYGDALASEEREDGNVPVFGSNGPVGSHNTANTRRPAIVVGRKGSHGKVNFSASEVFAIDTTYFIDDRFTRTDLRWLFYSLGTLGLDAVSKDSAVPGLAREDAYTHSLPVPDVGEQHTIADFLDRETAKIDTLVAKKLTLIERLKEKRIALISRTVTRGLPPDAAKKAGFDPHPKLKPSGIDWIGDVPEHWTLPPLYMRYQVDLGKMLNEAAISGKHLVPYLRNIDVQWDRINVSDLPEMDAGPWELARYTVRHGDLLVCEGGEVGRAALVRDAADGLGYQKALHRLRPLGVGEEPRFMFFTLCWGAHQGVFIAGGNPNTIPHLTGEKLRAYRFPAPPKPEQRAIADFLDRETAKLDAMVTKIETAIERLREYRTALITAAVTGKIDTRPVMETILT